MRTAWYLMSSPSPVSPWVQNWYSTAVLKPGVPCPSAFYVFIASRKQRRIVDFFSLKRKLPFKNGSDTSVPPYWFVLIQGEECFLLGSVTFYFCMRIFLLVNSVVHSSMWKLDNEVNSLQHQFSNWNSPFPDTWFPCLKQVMFSLWVRCGSYLRQQRWN